MLLDTEESGYPASNAYGISHVPSLFLVERDGTIAWSMEGFVKREFVAMAASRGCRAVSCRAKMCRSGKRVEAPKISSRREHGV